MSSGKSNRLNHISRGHRILEKEANLGGDIQHMVNNYSSLLERMSSGARVVAKYDGQGPCKDNSHSVRLHGQSPFILYSSREFILRMARMKKKLGEWQF